MKTTTQTDRLVRGQYRFRRRALPLAAAAAGLAVTLLGLWLAHPSRQPVAQWDGLRAGWIAGLIATGCLAAFAWWRRQRQNLVRSAAELDSEFTTMNRLETAVAEQADDSPLARAQRAETEAFLQRTKASSRHHWVPILGAAVLLLMAAHVATFVCWSPVVKKDKPAGAEGGTEARKQKEAEARAEASLEWQSPDSETKATAIEEVPLEAQARSTGGLREVTLEAQVNGVKRLTQPLGLPELETPGDHPVKTSLLLDQLAVQPFDIVSYHLHAQRRESRVLARTASPVQFIQVKPLREDTFICQGGDKPSKCFNYVTALKAAQLRLMKENFALAQAEIGHDTETWVSENARVAGEQGQLSDKTDEVLQLMTTNNYPPEILALVKKARPLVETAAQQIQSRNNQTAIASQGQALGYFTEVERYLKQTISLSANTLEPKAADPFAENKKIELKRRPKTPAVKASELAKEQSKLAGQLVEAAKPGDISVPAPEPDNPDHIGGTAEQRQAEIEKRIGALIDDEPIEPKALEHLTKGHALAGQAHEQLAQGDAVGAREPAATAAVELRATAEALREGDGQYVKNQLAAALRELAGAAATMRQLPEMNFAAGRMACQGAAGKVREIGRQLASDAEKLRGSDSRKLAAALSELSQAMTGNTLQESLARAGQQPGDPAAGEQAAKELSQLAQRAAQLRNPESLSRGELTRLVHKLERARTNLQRVAGDSTPGQAPGRNTQPSQGQQPAAAQAKANAQPSANEKTSEASGNSGGKGKEGQPATPGAQSLAANAAQDIREALLESPSGGHGTELTGKLAVAVESGGIGASSAAELSDYAKVVLPPLDEMITWLRSDLVEVRRDHVLTEQELALAPVAYRSAVAEYFETVSRAEATNRSKAKP